MTTLLRISDIPSDGSPIVITNPDTYILDEDISFPGTGVIVACPDVILDLNGNTITFGNEDPLSPVTWKGSSLPITLTGPTTLISDPIFLPKVRTYVALAVPYADDTEYQATWKLSVLDPTGNILGTALSSNVARGIGAVVSFKPLTPTTITLKLESVPSDNIQVPTRLIAAEVSPAYDRGIVATQRWEGEIPGSGDWPQAALSGFRTANRLSIRNGTILQGKSRSYGANLIYADLLGINLKDPTKPGILNLENITASCFGTDSNSINASETVATVKISWCKFIDSISLITNRLLLFSTLSVTRNKLPMAISFNQILGCPQCGISLDSNDPAGWINIIGNEISQSAVVTNGYAIGGMGIQNFTIQGNYIHPKNGRGIDIDGVRATPINNGIISGNIVKVREVPDREYQTGNIIRALRVRNNVDSEGPIRNLTITGNDLTATVGNDCGPTGEAQALRISLVNNNHVMDNANIVIRGNTLRSLVDTDDLINRASSLVVDGMDPGIKASIDGNILESNDTAIRLGGPDDGPISDLIISNSTFSYRSDLRLSSRDFQGYWVGYYEGTVDAAIIGVVLGAGSNQNVTYLGQARKSLTFGNISREITQVQIQSGNDSPVVVFNAK